MTKEIDNERISHNKALSSRLEIKTNRCEFFKENTKRMTAVLVVINKDTTVV